MELPLLQTDAWLEFQRSFGRTIFSYDHNGIRARFIRQQAALGWNWLYCPQGPLIDYSVMSGGVHHAYEAFEHWLIEQATREKSLFVKVEPHDVKAAELIATGKFQHTNESVQPHRTIIVDLNGDNNELLGRMHHKTRYHIRLAEREGITVASHGTIEEFLELMKQTTKRDQFRAHHDDYYRAQLEFFKHRTDVTLELWIARTHGAAAAAALVATHGSNSYYLHGASNYAYRELRAPFALHWAIMRALRERGVQHYDLWGIDANKWPGVTRFKSGWGGRLVEYPGAFDMKLRALPSFAYKTLKRLRRLI